MEYIVMNVGKSKLLRELQFGDTLYILKNPYKYNINSAFPCGSNVVHIDEWTDMCELFALRLYEFDRIVFYTYDSLSESREYAENIDKLLPNKCIFMFGKE